MSAAAFCADLEALSFSDLERQKIGEIVRLYRDHYGEESWREELLQSLEYLSLSQERIG